MEYSVANVAQEFSQPSFSHIQPVPVLCLTVDGVASGHGSGGLTAEGGEIDREYS